MAAEKKAKARHEGEAPKTSTHTVLAPRKQELDWILSAVEGLELDVRQEAFLRSRWYPRICDMEMKAAKAKKRHYITRMVVIAGSAAVPALVSLRATQAPNGDGGLGIPDPLTVVTLCISLAVTICAGMSEFFRFGDRWRHYRATVESLKSEGWGFLQLAGRYRRFKRHAQGFRRFAEQVESLLSEERQVFIAEIAEDKQPGEADKHQATAPA